MPAVRASAAAVRGCSSAHDRCAHTSFAHGAGSFAWPRPGTRRCSTSGHDHNPSTGTALCRILANHISPRAAPAWPSRTTPWLDSHALLCDKGGIQRGSPCLGVPAARVRVVPDPRTFSGQSTRRILRRLHCRPHPHRTRSGLRTTSNQTQREQEAMHNPCYHNGTRSQPTT